jgi:hypothetical protein
MILLFRPKLLISFSTFTRLYVSLSPTDSERQPEQESRNCAQFVSGQPGPELPAPKFATDPICPPLSCHRLDDPIKTNTPQLCTPPQNKLTTNQKE